MCASFDPKKQYVMCAKISILCENDHTYTFAIILLKCYLVFELAKGT